MIKAWVFDFNMGRKNTDIVKIDYAIKQHRNIIVKINSSRKILTNTQQSQICQYPLYINNNAATPKASSEVSRII